MRTLKFVWLCAMRFGFTLIFCQTLRIVTLFEEPLWFKALLIIGVLALYRLFRLTGFHLLPDCIYDSFRDKRKEARNGNKGASASKRSRAA